MSDIFLSYASVDRERIKPLVEALQKCGFAVRGDPTILPGQVWRQVIDEALNAARCVVVVWSQASISSHWVAQEAEDGLQRRILVPMMLDQVRIPLGFRGLQAANLIDWNGATAHPEFDKLVRAIGALMPGPQLPVASENMQAAQPDAHVNLPPLVHPAPIAESGRSATS